MSQTLISLAGFQVIISGRFWVIAEGVRAYSEALRYAPEDPEIRSALQNQIERVSRKDLAEVTPLRDPHME